MLVHRVAVAGLFVALSILFAGCSTSPQVPYATEQERMAWIEGIGAWRQDHPQYRNYIIKPGFGGPSTNEQAAKRQALQNAYQQFGGALDPSQLDVLEDKPIQISRGGKFLWYSDVYVGFDQSREDLRPVLILHLATLQRSLPRIRERQKGLSAIGWPCVIFGAASSVMVVASYRRGNQAYEHYINASTSPKANQYRAEAERWSVALTASAVGVVALPVGSILLRVRPDVKQVQQQIDTITAILISLPPAKKSL